MGVCDDTRFDGLEKEGPEAGGRVQILRLDVSPVWTLSGCCFGGWRRIRKNHLLNSSLFGGPCVFLL